MMYSLYYVVWQYDCCAARKIGNYDLLVYVKDKLYIMMTLIQGVIKVEINLKLHYKLDKTKLYLQDET